MTTPQDSLIEQKLMDIIDKNPLMYKGEIMDKVEQDLVVPRPTIRRVKKALLVKLQTYRDCLL